jgi:phage repressor protein C with HTH and peptisase S24 domain
MNNTSYKAEIQHFSDFKLYSEIKKYLKEEHLGLKHNAPKLDILYKLSQSRNSDIFEQASKDALEEYHKRKSFSYQKSQNTLNDDQTNEGLELLEHRNILDQLDIPKEDIYLCAVKGNSMKGINIEDGDTLLAQKKKSTESGDIIIASINGKFFVKRYKEIDGDKWLISENMAINDVLITEEMKFKIEGKVIGVFKRI